MAKQHGLIYNIYDDLSEAVKGIAGKVTLQRRPKQTEGQELDSFIVVELPGNIRNLIAGGIERMPHTFGTFTVFCKAKKDGTLNVGTQDDLVDAVLKKFPINGTHVAATRPHVHMQGEDGFGYQATLVSFTLRGK